jgi:hypothetical protein
MAFASRAVGHLDGQQPNDAPTSGDGDALVAFQRLQAARNSRSTAIDSCSTRRALRLPTSAGQHPTNGTANNYAKATPSIIEAWEQQARCFGTQADNPTHEDQMGLMQPRYPTPVVQRRASRRSTLTASSASSSTRWAHYFERNHGERFTKLMDKYLPDRRSRHDQLNGSPWAEEA